MAREKYVRVMCDWCADPLWNRDGAMMSVDDLPISRDLAFNLGHWAGWFESRKSDDDIVNLEGFAALGLKLAKRVKQELPDWTVIYFDESKINRDINQPREEFEYEITEEIAQQG